VLGSKSIGKTKVLNCINEEFVTNPADVMVVYVNAREQASGSLGNGIQLALKRLDKRHFFKEIDWRSLRENLADLVSLLGNEKAGKIATKVNGLFDAMNLCGSVRELDDADINFVHPIVALAKQKKQRPCLIIDEANLCLNGGLNEDKIINQFLHFVKEDHQMSVILCTSKHSFPAQLERSGVQLGFVKLVEVEEPPPYAVWKFLTKEKNFNGDCIIGMGRNLAKLCIALAGGNVYLIQRTIEELAERKMQFKGSQIVKLIEGALAVEEEVTGNPDARTVLENLAKFGYVKAAEAKEPTRTHLIKKSIAGLLTEGFTFFSDTGKVVSDYDILVPSSLGLRNRIVLELHKASNDGETSETSSTPCS
jgi:hypothetical protein